MPFCRFEVRTPRRMFSNYGAEFADSTAARIEAAKRIGALLHEHANQLWTDEDWQMDLTDADGLILYVIQVAAIAAPSTASHR